jgi:hypothetical protein
VGAVKERSALPHTHPSSERLPKLRFRASQLFIQKYRGLSKIDPQPLSDDDTKRSYRDRERIEATSSSTRRYVKRLRPGTLHNTRGFSDLSRRLGLLNVKVTIGSRNASMWERH